MGSKESIVSVIGVRSIKELSKRTNRVRTKNSFFIKRGEVEIEENRGRWNYEVYIEPFDIKAYSFKENPFRYYVEKGKHIGYMVPIMTSSLHAPEHIVNVKGNTIAYECEREIVLGRIS